MFALGVTFLYGVADHRGHHRVAMTMLASLTLLPALLGFIGSARCPARAGAAGRGSARRPKATGFWAPLGGAAVERRPVLLGNRRASPSWSC